MIVQCQALNKLLDTGDKSFLTSNNLTPDFFSDYPNEYQFIKNHIDQYGSVPDKATFISEFPQFDVVAVNEPDNYLIDQLYEDKNRRTLAKIFNKVRDLLNAGKTDEASKLYTSAADQLVKAQHIQSVDLFHDTSRYKTYTEKINNFDKYYVSTGFKELDEVIGGWDRQEELATIVARPGVGKCLEMGTPVLMADGTLKPVEKIQVGDRVQSEHGVNTVVALHSGHSAGYRITPYRGEPFVISAGHILTLAARNLHWDSKKKYSTTSHQYTLIDMSIEDYIALPQYKKHHLSLYLPAVDYEEKDLQIPPYIVGLWLGDGTTSEVSLTSMDDPLIEAWKSYAQQMNLSVSERPSLKSPVKTYAITSGTRGGSPTRNRVLELFKSYGLIGHKHIPLEYMTGSREQRLQLLAGILDTDGHYNGTMYELVLANKELVVQVQQLARSLGFRGSNVMHYCRNGFHRYGITIAGPFLQDIPVKVPHKQAKAPNARQQAKKLNLTGFQVEPVAEVDYFGFQVDGDSRFILGNGILTHNSQVTLKMALAAAEQGLIVGMYSGEMSETKVGYRVDTFISHISNTKITKGNGDVQVEYKKYLEDLPNMFKGTIKVLTPAMVGGPVGVSALRAFVEREHLDMLVVDQHSLLEDDRKGKSPVEKAANISRDLKNLQVMTKIPVIAVSQQNRESTEKGVGTEHVSQSDRISQDSTIILFLEKKDDVLTLDLVKSRDGGSGKKLKYVVNWDKGIFQYVPSEGDATNGAHCEELEKEYEYQETDQEGVF